MEHVAEVPPLDPLVEGGILDVQAGPADFQGRTAGHLACPLADNGKTPSARCVLGFGDGGPDHPNLSFIGVEGLNLVHIPELNMFFGMGIILDLAGPLALPYG